ncbi:radical SAM protein [Acidocella aromatica]|nr:radical SAM protein [Acidocella aromatica]
MDAMTTHAPHYQGYLDERSTHHVKGWLRDLNDASSRLVYEVVLPGEAGERVLASGTADAYSDVLVQVGVGDGGYAFTAFFPAPLSMDERDGVFVRPAGSQHRLELAPALRTDPPGVGGPFQGYVDERSVRHVTGWVRDLSDAARRVSIEVVLPDEAGGEAVLAHVSANQPNDVLRQIGVGDGEYGFFVLFGTQLSEAERDRVFVRVRGAAHVLEFSPQLSARFEPIHHVAMDIVNNCNLRCPFCVYDYTDTKKTYAMSEETFRSVLRLIPFVTDGNFWLSCLHEATLHPRLTEFIAMVPREYRHKLFFTTNLAKRQPRAYFEALAQSGMSHINVSLESLDPPVYEKMRKGARFPIFMENWAQLLDVFSTTPQAPGIRYNVMAYRSNFREIPELIRILREQKRAWQVEIRNTFDGPQIASAFRDEEFLSSAEWAELAEALRGYHPDEVILLLPPGGKGYDPEDRAAALALAPRQAAEAPDDADLLPASTEVPAGESQQEWEIAEGPVPRPFNLRVAWDGTLNVYSERVRNPGEPPRHENYFVVNINELEDPVAALLALS